MEGGPAEAVPRSAPSPCPGRTARSWTWNKQALWGPTWPLSLRAPAALGEANELGLPQHLWLPAKLDSIRPVTCQNETSQKTLTPTPAHVTHTA